MFLLFVTMMQQSIAQSITGTVTSKGVALEGTTVKIKGEDKSTVTTKEGKFSLTSLQKQPVISFSHVGYKTVEVKAGSDTLNIELEETAVTMKEVTVSTGYQELSKENATGSFDKIDNKLFSREQSADVMSRLEGITSSMQFQKVGAASGIFIRGLSTLRASTSPLIVLDDFPYEGDINNINPSDIESITILKDAAASAIWGARAGNGVIVMTTKKGKFGEKNKISFNGNVSFQKRPDIFSDQNFLDPAAFIGVEKFLFSKGKYDADLSNTSDRPIISPVVEILAQQRSGQLTAAAADEKINVLGQHDVRNDYAKYLYREGIRQQYSLGLTGGSATFNYLLNGGYDINLSNLTGNDNTRATLAAITNLRAGKKMDVQFSMNYAFSKANNNSIVPIIPSGKSGLYPYAQLADANGKSLPVEYLYRNSYLDTAGRGLLYDWQYRPLDELRLGDNASISDDILLKLGIHYKISKDMQAQVSGQYEKDFTTSRNYSSIETFVARNMINLYSQRSASGIIHNFPVGGILEHTQNTLSAYAARVQLNYSHTCGSNNFIAIAGTETRQTRSNTEGFTLYGYDDNTLSATSADYVTNFTLFDNFGTSTIPDNSRLSDVLNRFISVYSNAIFTFHNKYSFSASARKDASNLFGVSTNNKWAPLWSAGAGWKISEEPFYHSAAIPLLKLRLSYGYSGNIRNDLAAVSTIRYISVSPITNLLYANVSTLPNPSLRWEKVGILNAAIDLATKGDKVSGSIEYYHKNAVDLLTPTNINPTLGISQMTMNAADLTGDGVDLKLNFRITDRKIKINTMLLSSYVTNKVSRYLITNANKGSYVGNGYSPLPMEGKDPYSLVSYRWAGLDPMTGDPMGYLNGVVSKDYAKLVIPASFDDVVFTGTTRPPFYGNLLNSITFKAITLSVNIGYKAGYYFRRSGINYSNLFNSWTGNSEFADRWQKPGDELTTSVPSMTYPSITNRDKFYNNSEATVVKGDHIRIQDISLTYEPSKIFTKALKRFQLYLYANNIGVIWRANKYHLDPDLGTGLPVPFSFTAGLKAEF